MKKLLLLLFVPIVIYAYSRGFGYVTYIEGGNPYIESVEGEKEILTINMILEEGDLLRTDGAMVEIEFFNGGLVRLDKYTELYVDELIKDQNVIILELERGRLEFDIPRDIDTKIIIRTPSLNIAASEGTAAFLEVEEDGYLRVITKRKAVELRGLENVLLERKEMAYVSPDGEILTIRRLRRWPEDEFTNFCERRDERIAYLLSHRERYVEIEERTVFILNLYGEWKFVPPYGFVWIPHVGPGWRPYRYGRWVYTVSFGWVWIPEEPWGFIPFHYGRWAYVIGIGWVWIPGTIWGPGWVVWYCGPGYIAWAPLDPYDEPIITVSIGVTYVTGWTCVTKKSFYHPDPHIKPKSPRHSPPKNFYNYVENVSLKNVIRIENPPRRNGSMEEIFLPRGKSKRKTIDERKFINRSRVDVARREKIELNPSSRRSKDVKRIWGEKVYSTDNHKNKDKKASIFSKTLGELEKSFERRNLKRRVERKYFLKKFKVDRVLRRHE